MDEDDAKKKVNPGVTLWASKFGEIQNSCVHLYQTW